MHLYSINSRAAEKGDFLFAPHKLIKLKNLKTGATGTDMYTEEEGDFWKEKLNLMRIQNMRLSAKNEDKTLEEKIDELSGAFSSLKLEVQKTEGSLSWEIEISPSLKLRSFHTRNPEYDEAAESTGSQSENDGSAVSTPKYCISPAKISILGKTDTGFEKVADAKFPNDPFILITHFLNHFEGYRKELEEIKSSALKFRKKQEIAYRTIHALLSEKYEKTDTLWLLQKTKNAFTLSIKEKAGTRNTTLSMENFLKEIDEL